MKLSSRINNTFGSTKKEIQYYGRASILSLLKPVAGGRLFTELTAIRGTVQPYKYDAPAPPLRTIRIAPAEVQWWTTGLLKGWGLGQIRGGDWDINNNIQPINNSVTRKGLRQRFLHNREWDETVYVKRAAKQIDVHGSFWGYESLSEFKTKRCTYVDQLYERIREQGYSPNSDLKMPESDIRQGRQQLHHQLEPLVAIGRDGRIFYVDGIHRFTIAEILKLDIPVNVLARHRRWQKVRDCIASARTINEIPSSIQPYVQHQDIDIPK